MKLHLLPEPRRIRFTGGVFSFEEGIRLLLDPSAGPAGLKAATLLNQAIGSELGLTPLLDVPGLRKPSDKHIRLAVEPGSNPEAYKLSISPRCVRLIGAGPAGLFYGMQTLVQIVRDRGSKLPCANIIDEPAFRNRGFYLDISRGKVPTLHTLKRVVDRLAALKINQFQLYVEHVFDFKFDPSIGEGCDPLRPHEIMELDHYCREQHIALVPSLACFGHMGRILSLPQYRALAAVEWPAPDWESAPWAQRLHGATLNPALPGSRKLIQRMLDDFLPLFSAPYFNMCGDETYDLGKGRSARTTARRGRAALYIEHLEFVRKLAERYGKRLMFWGDVMLHHKDFIDKVPKDCIALDWGYHANTPFEKIGEFVGAGLEAYACPSTRGYKVVFNEVEEARLNISGYARTGHKLGASGLLTTDWGDLGHFNMLACSFHGMALGAAMAWNPSSDEGKAFDRSFALNFFGDRSGLAGRLYSQAGSAGIAEWPLLIGDLHAREITPAMVKKAMRLRNQIISWEEDFRRMKPACHVEEHDLEQLAAACTAMRLNVDRILLEHDARSGARARFSRGVAAFRRDLRNFVKRYSSIWLAANRTAGLPELTRFMEAGADKLGRDKR